ALVRGIESHGPRQAILRGIHQVCVDLGIDVVVEGVETVEEFAWCHSQGIHLYQGYLFARPMFEGMPGFELPCHAAADTHPGHRRDRTALRTQPGRRASASGSSR
ncbi:EAL domain-containing protein, partial [Lysobacter sp. D1-1-M9]|uniref:EAL domain-containing protein n=1 Tax=Novilysobacter longmucuonensis TaxID=3098603 RepID=UPI002FC5E484